MSALQLRPGAQLGRQATRVALDPGVVRMEAADVVRTLVEPRCAVLRIAPAVVDDAPVDGALVLLPDGRLAWLPADALRDAEEPGCTLVVRPTAAIAAEVRACWVACEAAEDSDWELDHVDAEYVYLRSGDTAGPGAALYRVLPEEVAAADETVWRSVCPLAIVDTTIDPSAWEAFVLRFLGEQHDLPLVRNAERWAVNLPAPAAEPPNPTALVVAEPDHALTTPQTPALVHTSPAPVTHAVATPAPQLEPGEVQQPGPRLDATGPVSAPVRAPAQPRGSITPLQATVRQTSDGTTQRVEIEPSSSPPVARPQFEITPARAERAAAPVVRTHEVVERLASDDAHVASPRPSASDPTADVIDASVAARPSHAPSPVVAPSSRRPDPTERNLPASAERERESTSPVIRASFPKTAPPRPPQDGSSLRPRAHDEPSTSTPRLLASREPEPRPSSARPRPSVRDTGRDGFPAPPAAAAPAAEYRVGAETIELGSLVVTIGDRNDGHARPREGSTRTIGGPSTRTGSLLAEIPTGRGWKGVL